MENIEDILLKLSEKRPVFESEADFQFELAWAIKEYYGDRVEIRLERTPKFNKNMRIDIWAVLDGEPVAIELKYKTRALELENAEFRLLNQSAQDIGRYLYLADIMRIERVLEETSCRVGYTIFITNDLSYTRPARGHTKYGDFALAEGAVKTGRLRWSDGSSALGKGQLKNPVVLRGKYPIAWRDYARVDDSKAGTFKYLLNKITV